jgi:hypothetical protein
MFKIKMVCGKRLDKLVLRAQSQIREKQRPKTF